LYTPSLELQNYRLEFLAQVVKKGISFVFRATDDRNYYVTRLVVTKSGSLPAASIIRYSVVDGKTGQITQLPLPLAIREDTIYRILQTVEGDQFATYVNGQLVDSWSDGRLDTGGVGFFADKGEISRLRWFQILDRDDFVGWLCSQVSRGSADRRASGVKHE
jgi:hypothetical protein